MLSVHTNILAANAERQLNINTKKREKNAEKLASGYKINRAADDAAGLSISETMRRLIRGLQRGSENITEGISLIKVADAALGEITDMLQRINELSIKAYNGTNTPLDRQFIQEEVDQLLEEIGRTGETTVYNEIQVLKWEPSFTQEVTLKEDQILTRPMTIDVRTPLPAWLNDGIDEKLELHSGYENLKDNFGNTVEQDTSGIMITAKKDALGNFVRDADGMLTYKYYGSNLGNPYGEKKAEYAGEWTESLSDNATAKISYAGLKIFDNTADLYGGLIQLLGGGIGISCGTCSSKQYGINFTGSVDGITVNGIRPYNEGRSTPNLDLGEFKPFTNEAGEAINCFERIKELADKQNDPNLKEDDKKQQVRDLAGEIALALSKKTYELMSNDPDMKDHFTKSILTEDNDILVYDYRDNSALTYEKAVDTTVRTWAWSERTYPASYVEPGITGAIKVPHDLYIVCSAQDSDDIPIELPYVSLEKLGIVGYNVANYRKVENYSEDYKKKLADWEASAYEEIVSSKIKVPLYETKTEQIYINGESNFLHKIKKVGEKELDVSYTVKKYALEKPEAKAGDIEVTEWYEPDDNRLIRDALQQVSLWRTNLGATQNRLEHTYNNNGNKEENLTAADSRIRDTDVAKEMVDFSNNNILQQAGVSMMVHANQDRQYILNMLQ